ncbi:MAG TPA: JDVT-CTERM system glutamic-type intramembrane protease [Pirellulales bacterium]|nr:JDVT-CTERM system glutamic-type intramembrane protease [Pirellulales bacterium]
MDWPTIIVAALMIALAIPAWGRAAYRIRSAEPVVAFEPRRNVPWRLGDLLMIVLFYLLANFAFHKVCLFIAHSAGDEQVKLLPNPAEETVTAEALAVATAASIATNLAATGFALLWIFSHTDATWSDLGWRRETIRSDVVLGVWVFAAIAAPIYGLQALLSPLTDQQHPIIEVLLREGTPLVYILSGLSAVIVAPLAEEFFFRMLMQGWMETMSTRGASLVAEPAEPLPPSPRGGPVLVSSLIFALMHLGHGTDPIPLFFLALALGYLYQRTHRLLPSVTVHFCLNACSFLMLCLSRLS